jgi:hypothetical protein
MEFEKHSSGVAKAGLTTGVIGTSLGALNLLGNGGMGVLGGLLGGANPSMGAIGCTRELMEKDLKISELNTEVKLRDSTIYTDQKSLDLYRYIDGQLANINAQIAAQAVQNQATKDSFQLLNERLCCEQKERRCADNSIVNYANATFYPKMVADVTTGTTTTAQMLYNPLPVDNCCGC